LLNPDAQVVELGVPYFQARVCALMAVGVLMSFRGYFTGTARAGLFLGTQVFIHLTNIALSLALIFGYFGLPALGVLGAGIGTAVSLWLGMGVYLALGFAIARPHGFGVRLPDADTLKGVAGQALPAATEQTWTYFTHSVMFWIIAQIGTAEVAAATVLMNMVAVMLVPAIALGVSAATLVGRSLGEGEPERAYQWGWHVARVGVVALATVGLPMWLFPYEMLGLFIDDPATLAAGHLPMILLGAAAGLDGIATVMMFALLGSGNAGTVMKFSMSLQTVVLVSSFVVGPILGLGLTAVWACNVLNRVSLAAVFGTIWYRRGWLPPAPEAAPA
jgi:Na+-driven multidrug efflux pump